MTYAPVETTVGVIRGRDAFHCTEVRFTEGRALHVAGDLNTALCDGPADVGFTPFRFEFYGVLKLTVVELDFFDGTAYVSSFDEADDSVWMAEMRGRDSASKLSAEHRHLRLVTYDDVFELVCHRFEFLTGAEARCAL